MKIVFLLSGLLLAAPVGGVPDDPRLVTVREELQQVIDKAAQDGIPTGLLVSKIHEGLAKGVAAPRIRAVVDEMAKGLVQARVLVVARRSGAPDDGLVQALAEARMAGVPLSVTEPLVAGEQKAKEVSRAVQVLTDLALRGYPAARTAPLVRDLLVRDLPALPRLAAGLETLRRESALTQVEAVDALSRGLAATGTLGPGLRRSVDEERRKIPGRGRDDRPFREPPGKGAVPPGHDPARGKPPHPKKF